MDWKSVAEKIIQDDQNKWEQRWLAEELEVTKLGHDVWPFSDLAMGQFCQKLDIPVRYFRRLPDEMKIVVANYDLERLKGTSFLVRGKGNWIRAFLSAEYVAYNNCEIAQNAESLLRNGALDVKSFVLEETHMFLKIISEDIVDRGAGLKAGIMIGNSEVGMGSVSVEPLYLENHAPTILLLVRKKVSVTRTFILSNIKCAAVWLKAVSEGFRLASSILDAFLKTREVKVIDPLEVIKKIAEEREFSQKITDEVLSSYLVEPEANWL